LRSVQTDYFIRSCAIWLVSRAFGVMAMPALAEESLKRSLVGSRASKVT
jgi:hypothetical protein